MKMILRGLLPLAALLAPSVASAQSTSNFGMVGYDLDMTGEEAFLQSITGFTDQCQVTELAEPNVLCLVQNDKQGELWIGFKKNGDRLEFITANPGLPGKGKFPAKFVTRVSDPEWEPFEYKISVQFSSLDIPLLIEVADPRTAGTFSDIEEGAALTLDVTAFTFNPEIYESPEDFRKAVQESGHELKLAPEHFIPIGLFGDDPTAHAAFGGTIKKAELRTTSDGATFWVTLVEILEGATVNAVFDDISVTKPPKVGQFIVGEYWLSGRIADEAVMAAN